MANPSIVPVPRNLYTALKSLPEFSLPMVNRLPVLITPPVITVVLITAETQNQHIIMRNQVRASENSYNYGTPLFDSPWSFFLAQDITAKSVPLLPQLQLQLLRLLLLLLLVAVDRGNFYRKGLSIISPAIVLVDQG